MATTPTIWCTIKRVRRRPRWRRAGVKVTVADCAGAAVTVVLTAADLETYASFQAAILRATGHPFRYLSGTVPRGSQMAESVRLARIAGCRPIALLRKLTAAPLILKGMLKRLVMDSNAASAE